MNVGRDVAALVRRMAAMDNRTVLRWLEMLIAREADSRGMLPKSLAKLAGSPEYIAARCSDGQR